MRNGLKLLLLASTFILPSFTVAQVEIEFGNFGSCPVLFTQGTDAYELCEQQRMSRKDRGRPVRYESKIFNENETLPNENGNRFNIRERYE